MDSALTANATAGEGGLATTARSRRALTTATSTARVLTESVSATRASPAQTVPLACARLIAVAMGTVLKTVPRASATTAGPGSIVRSGCVLPNARGTDSATMVRASASLASQASIARSHPARHRVLATGSAHHRGLLSRVCVTRASPASIARTKLARTTATGAGSVSMACARATRALAVPTVPLRALDPMVESALGTASVWVECARAARAGPDTHVTSARVRQSVRNMVTATTASVSARRAIVAKTVPTAWSHNPASAPSSVYENV